MINLRLDDSLAEIVWMTPPPGSLVSRPDRPRPAFVFPGGEEGSQPEKPVGRVDEARKTGIPQTDLREKLPLFFEALDIGELGFKLPANDDGFRAHTLRYLPHRLHISVSSNARFVDIADENLLLHRDEKGGPHGKLFILLQRDGPSGRSFLERRPDF